MPDKDNWFQRFLKIQTRQPVMPGVATSAAAFNRDIPREESTVGDDLAYTGALLASPLIGTNFVKNMAVGLPAFEVFDRLPTLIGDDRATVQGGNLLERGFRAIIPDGKFENTVAPYINQAGQVIAGLPVGGFGELFSRRAASGIAGALDRAAQRGVANRLGYFEPMSDVLSAEHLQSFELPEVSVAPIIEQKAVQAAVPYAIDDLGGGYMLKSLMRGNPLEKQMGKNGTVNVNNVRALVGKGSKVEQAVVDKVLASDAFAGKKSIDYNKFRKAVQDELITYDRTPDTRYNAYGIDRLRVGHDNDSPYANSIWRYRPAQVNLLRENPTRTQGWRIEPDGYFATGDASEGDFRLISPEEVNSIFPNWIDIYSEKGSSAVPSTYLFSSPRIPNGSAKHYDANTLGHSRTYTTADEPDVLHVMESQSDWAQQAKRGKIAKDVEKAASQYKKDTDRANALFNENVDIEEKLARGVRPDGTNIEHDYEYREIREIIERNEETRKTLLDRAKKYDMIIRPDKYVQEAYLQDNYTSRQIQENLRYAAEKGQKKMRYPTRETAAKIEGYSKSRSQSLQDNPELQRHYDELRDALRAEENRIIEKYAPEDYLDESLREADFGDMGLSEEQTKRLIDRIRRSEEFEKSAEGSKMREEIIRAREKMDPDRWLRENVPETYIPGHETILRKYDAFPKQYQKLYKNADVRTVTDPKGNTWYEVDVPENYLQQEWAYKHGGLISRLQKHYGSNEKALEAIRKFAGGGPLGEEYAGPPAPYVPSESIRNYIKSMEAFRGDWYNDGNGIPTVGYGFTGKNVKAAYPDGMTREQADAYFDDLVTRFARRMSQLTPNIDRLTQNQKDALFSYFYNIGEGNYSTGSPKMQQALKDMDWDTVVQNIDAGYNDKKNPGLKKRRDYERALFERDIPRPLMPVPPAKSVGFLYNPNIQRTVGTIPLSGGADETYNPAMYRTGGNLLWPRGTVERRNYNGVPTTLESYKQQQRNAIIDSAVQKALKRDEGVAPVINGKLNESCLYTVTDNFGKKYRVAGNQAFMANPGKYGFEVNGPIENAGIGTLYQFIDPQEDLGKVVPHHMVLITGYDDSGNPLVSYSHGNAGLSPKEKDYKRNTPLWDSYGYETYRFVGTPDDNVRWEQEYAALPAYDLIPPVHNNLENLRDDYRLLHAEGGLLKDYRSGGFAEKVKDKILKIAASALNDEKLAQRAVNFAVNHPRLFEALKPEIRQRLYDYVDPQGYNDIGFRITNALNEESEYRTGFHGRDNIWAEYLQIPENKRHNYDDAAKVVPSRYRPTKGKDENADYKAIELDERQKFNTIFDALRDSSSNKSSSPHTALTNYFSTHTLGVGFDKNGQYVSYYDLWDLNPKFGASVGEWESKDSVADKAIGSVLDDKNVDQTFGIGKPLEFYDRIYLNDFFGVQPDLSPNTFYGGWIQPAYLEENRSEEYPWRITGDELFEFHEEIPYTNGGKIHIKPENRGKFTALKKRTGHSASWFKAHGTPAQKKMATFALNSRKWKHGDGGIIDRLYNHSGGDVGRMLELIQKARSA